MHATSSAIFSERVFLETAIRPRGDTEKANSCVILHVWNNYILRIKVNRRSGTAKKKIKDKNGLDVIIITFSADTTLLQICICYVHFADLIRVAPFYANRSQALYFTGLVL